MDPRHLEAATEFCKLVGSTDLYDYLHVAHEAAAPEVLGALREKRKYLQGMQSNPKLRAQAMFLIKNYGALESIVADPAYLKAARKQQEASTLPMLEMAIDSVLADGVLTSEEEEFVRRNALELGIPVERYEIGRAHV